MKDEAKEHEEDDKKEKEKADTINKGNSIVFQNESMLDNFKDKISEEDKKNIQGFVDEMKQAVKDKDVNKINDIEKKINDAWRPISQKMYSTQGNVKTNNSASDNTNSSSNSGNKDDNVQDADFEEVK